MGPIPIGLGPLCKEIRTQTRRAETCEGRGRRQRSAAECATLKNASLVWGLFWADHLGKKTKNTTHRRNSESRVEVTLLQGKATSERGPVWGRKLLPEITYLSERFMCMSGQSLLSKHLHFHLPPSPLCHLKPQILAQDILYTHTHTHTHTRPNRLAAFWVFLYLCEATVYN